MTRDPSPASTGRAILLDLLRLAARDDPITLDAALDHLVRAAARLVDARYAAIGVVDPDRPGRLALFVVTGIDDALARRLGDPPVGRGLLGSLLLRGEPLRLDDLRQHEDFTGFPPHHPPMGSFLGVPVRAGEEPLGYLYLTEKRGAATFSDDDEEAVTALAQAAATEIVQARRYELERTRAAWLDATLAISSTLVAAEDPVDALGEVCRRAREVAGADLARLEVRQDDAPVHTWVSRADDAAASAEQDLGAALPLVADDADGLGRPVRSGVGDEPRLVVVPLSTRSGLRGTLSLAWRPEHRARYERVPSELPASLAEQAALAVEIAEARRTGRRVAVLEERHRIARDLHDVILQQLFAAKLDVEACARRSDQPDLSARLAGTAAELQGVIRDLRRTVFGLGWADAVQDAPGAVRAVVARAASVLKLRPVLHLEGPLERLDADRVTDLVAVLTELLSNVARHAGTDRVEVSVLVDEDLTVVVEDDGEGIPEDAPRSGLRNLRDRATAHGGALVVAAGPDGAGTRLTWSVPARAARPGPDTPSG